MSAAALAQTSWPTIHRQFEAVLPQIENTIRFQFRRWPRRRREEAVADARAAAWHAWHGLITRGKDPLAVGPNGIAFNACRYVKSGRRLGTGPCGRAAMDVYQRRAQERLGFKLVGFDPETNRGPGSSQNGWREWLATDNRWTPANEAAFRLDFTSWLEMLPLRKRRVAELLADGHGTGEVALYLRVTPGAVSQARTWLEASWQRFQAEPTTAP